MKINLYVASLLCLLPFLNIAKAQLIVDDAQTQKSTITIQNVNISNPPQSLFVFVKRQSGINALRATIPPLGKISLSYSVPDQLDGLFWTITPPTLSSPIKCIGSVRKGKTTALVQVSITSPPNSLYTCTVE